MESKKQRPVSVKIRLWLERDGENQIGLGVVLLLQHIERLGSLNQAAAAMHMSYRGAWGKVKKAEQRLGQALVNKTSGKGQKFEVSPFGKELMETFQSLLKDVQDHAEQRARETLPVPIDIS